MNYTLQLEIDPSEGALLRVLGLATRRGHEPLAVEARPAPHGALRVRLAFSGGPPPAPLVRQLGALHDVRRVTACGDECGVRGDGLVLGEGSGGF